MSTRSRTKVMVNNEVILNLYRHTDGYPAGHGVQLLDFLESTFISSELVQPKPAKLRVGNGNELAAELILFLGKAGSLPPSLAIMPLNLKEMGQAYEYLVYVDEDSRFWVTVSYCTPTGSTEILFNGLTSRYREWLTQVGAIPKDTELT